MREWPWKSPSGPLSWQWTPYTCQSDSFCAPSDPVADAEAVVFVQSGADGEGFVQDELVLQELQFLAVVRRVLCSPEAEVAHEGVLFLVSQLQGSPCAGRRTRPAARDGAMSWRRALTPGRPGKSGRPAPAREVSLKVLVALITATRPRAESHIGGSAGFVQVASAAGVGQINVPGSVPGW